MTEKLRNGFSLIELMVALGISTIILTLAFLTYGKIYTDSAKLEKYLKDEIIFQDEFAEIYRAFQNTRSISIPSSIPSSRPSTLEITPTPNSATPTPCPAPEPYDQSTDYSSICSTYTIREEIGSDEHIAYIYSLLRP